MKIPERCEECGGEHPTHICIKRFQKCQKPEMVVLPTTDDDSTGSDTLCGSEESEDNESNPPSTPLTKAVMFDLPEEEVEEPIPRLDQQLNQPGCQIQTATSQNEEADEHLVHVAWLRKTSDNVYMSNRKSMNLRTYVHAAH